MSQDHADAPYYKIFVWLTVFTIAEIAWAVVLEEYRFLLVLGLSAMAGIKAVLVALYYMHLKYEQKLLWAVILFPVLLVVIMVSGFLPDSIHYW